MTREHFPRSWRRFQTSHFPLHSSSPSDKFRFTPRGSPPYVGRVIIVIPSIVNQAAALSRMKRWIEVCNDALERRWQPVANKHRIDRRRERPRHKLSSRPPSDSVRFAERTALFSGRELGQTLCRSPVDPLLSRMIDCIFVPTLAADRTLRSNVARSIARVDDTHVGSKARRPFLFRQFGRSKPKR